MRYVTFLIWAGLACFLNEKVILLLYVTLFGKFTSVQ